MAEARVVRLEGVDQLCLLICEHGDLPEELVVNFGRSGSKSSGAVAPSRGDAVTYRLQPSSLAEASPVYVEIFDD